MCPFPLNKSNSLKSTSEIDLVFKDGSKLSSKLISLYYVKSDKENSLRIAFSAVCLLLRVHPICLYSGPRAFSPAT